MIKIQIPSNEAIENAKKKSEKNPYFETKTFGKFKNSQTLVSSSDEMKAAQISYHHASLARFIISPCISDWDNHKKRTDCNGVFSYKDKFYYSAKIKSVSSEEDNKANNNRREKNLQIISTIINRSNLEEKNLFSYLRENDYSDFENSQYGKIWSAVKEITCREIEHRSQSIDALTFSHLLQERNLAENLTAWKNLFIETKSIRDPGSNKKKRKQQKLLDVMPNKDLEEKLSELKKAILDLAKVEDSDIFFPVYFNQILFVHDYIKVFKDLDLYLTDNSDKSFLFETWECIKKRNWKDVSSKIHSELSIIQYIFNKETKDTKDLAIIFKSAQLREKEKPNKSPLIASKHNCFTCRKTIDVGSRIFNDEEKVNNLNPETGIVYPENKPLKFIFKENKKLNDLLTKFDSEVEQKLVELVSDENELKISNCFWCENQDFYTAVFLKQEN